MFVSLFGSEDPASTKNLLTNLENPDDALRLNAAALESLPHFVENPCIKKSDTRCVTISFLQIFCLLEGDMEKKNWLAFVYFFSNQIPCKSVIEASEFLPSGSIFCFPVQETRRTSGMAITEDRDMFWNLRMSPKSLSPMKLLR